MRRSCSRTRRQATSSPRLPPTWPRSPRALQQQVEFFRLDASANGFQGGIAGSRPSTAVRQAAVTATNSSSQKLPRRVRPRSIRPTASSRRLMQTPTPIQRLPRPRPSMGLRQPPPHRLQPEESPRPSAEALWLTLTTTTISSDSRREGAFHASVPDFGSRLHSSRNVGSMAARIGNFDRGLADGRRRHGCHDRF